LNSTPPLSSLSAAGQDVDDDDHDQYTSRDDDITDDEGGVLVLTDDEGEALSMGRTVDVEVGSGVNACTYKWKRVPSIAKDERADFPRFDLQANPPPPPPLLSIVFLTPSTHRCCFAGPQPQHQLHHYGG